MSIQIKDKIIFDNIKDIKGSVEILSGSEKLLKLESYDISCKDNNDTCCHRGYLAQYTLTDNKLTLKELQLNSEYDISIISNNAIKVTQNNLNNYTSKHHSISSSSDKYFLFDDKYTNINLPINYTGKLLAGYKKNHSSVITSKDCMNYWSNKYKYIIEISLTKGCIDNLRYLDTDEINQIIKDEKSKKNNIFKSFNKCKKFKFKNLKPLSK